MTSLVEAAKTTFGKTLRDTHPGVTERVIYLRKLLSVIQATTVNGIALPTQPRAGNQAAAARQSLASMQPQPGAGFQALQSKVEAQALEIAKLRAVIAQQAALLNPIAQQRTVHSSRAQEPEFLEGALTPSSGPNSGLPAHLQSTSLQEETEPPLNAGEVLHLGPRTSPAIVEGAPRAAKRARTSSYTTADCNGVELHKP